VSARAGIVVTGTEVLTGRVVDRNGPWCSEQLRALGVDHESTVVVGDRPADILAALHWLAAEGCSLIITSGGLGPTADDLTATVVGEFQRREMIVDAPLHQRITAILERLTARWPSVDQESIAAGNLKQATIPQGATILEPIGTAPGLVVPPPEGSGGPTVVVLPGPPSELVPMWDAAAQTPAFIAATEGRVKIEQSMLRLFGIPESEIAATLRAAQAEGIEIDELEITTCLRRGEIEIVTRFTPDKQELYDRFAEFVASTHAETIFSVDGTTIDQQLAALLSGPPLRTIALAESCTGGLVAARLTEMPGSSAYMRGALVVYSNEAKSKLAAVEPAMIEQYGAVSEEVAVALASGARSVLNADVGVGITGIAGPGGGTEQKPVGLVWCAVSLASGELAVRKLQLPGSRQLIRDRTTTVALHMTSRLLRETSL
jgi:nicotinamide-nucleotide amidase